MHQRLFDELVEEVAEYCGIRRSFVHERALANPSELFLAVMAWGFGASPPRYPAQRKMLVGAQAAVTVSTVQLGAVVTATQQRGAGPGWTALLRNNRIAGLNMSYGTKLLYFAGYTVDSPGPRPLILDDRVRQALCRLSPGTVPAAGKVWLANYLAYLNQAARWAADPRWNESPEVVEYALFRSPR
jgi:hypothetical protein